MSRNSNGKGFFYGAVFGGIVGSITALLLAPKSGKKMREDLTDKYCEVKEKAECSISDVINQAEDIVHRAKNIAEDAKDCFNLFLKKRR